MYKCAKKLLRFTCLIWAAATLTACGGASSGGEGDGSTTNNKPTVSSSAVSSSEESSSSPTAPISSSLASSSDTSQSVSSTYSRIARSSSEAVSSQSNPSVDETPPNTTTLHLYRLSERSITLTWDDATDNVGVSHYTIKRNGSLIAIVDFPSQMFADQSLLPATDYSYTITTFDAKGNHSGESAALSIRTLALANSSAAASSTPGASSAKSSSISSRSSSKSSAVASSASANSSVATSSASPQSSAGASSASAKSSSTASSTSSLSSSTSSLSSSASSATSAAIETITITWGHPNQREDGAFLDLDDIGGYEIRYRIPNNTRYTYVNLNGNRTTEYVFTGPVNNLEFEIAVFDTTGLYSQYVKITR